jgi:oxaloacetate decarboxylase beta subunit
MKRILQLLVLILFIAPSTVSAQQTENPTNVLTSGKWVNRSDGYVPVPTYNPKEKDDKTPRTTKRFKTFTFEENMTFLLDSAKQRYNGHYKTLDGKIFLSFNPVKTTHLRKNSNPNSTAGYETTDELITLNNRTLSLSADGTLQGDGFVYKNYSGAMSGLFNFYEFSGFATFRGGMF